MNKQLQNILKLNNHKPIVYAITCELKDEQILLNKTKHINHLGVNVFQLRQKHLSQTEFIKLGKNLKTVLNNKAILIVNDSIEVAQAINADGIHVGQDELDLASARESIGLNKILGVSVHTLEQALLAEQLGADYLGVGSMFSTSSKSDARRVDFNTLYEILNNVTIPVIVIGGINLGNFRQFSTLKIAGMAMISTLFNNDNYKHDVTYILKELNKW